MMDVRVFRDGVIKVRENIYSIMPDAIFSFSRMFWYSLGRFLQELLD